MRPVIMWNLVSLDGYFEGPTPWDLSFHEVAWGPDLERLSIEQLDMADTLLFGRNTYEGMAAYWPTATNEGEITPRMNAIQKLAFSNTLDRADWTNTRLVRGDAADEVERLKNEEGKAMLIFGSAKLSEALTKRGLIDEYRIGVAPILLGKGRPLFTDDTRRSLKLLDASPTATGCVVLRYARA